MSETTQKKDPALPGENPTVPEGRRITADYLGSAFTLIHSHRLPPYMPRGNERLLLNWLSQYLSAATTHATTFPNVFNGAGIYSVHRTRTLFERIVEAFTSLDKLPGISRGVTAWKNILLFNRDHLTSVLPPRAETGMLPAPEAAPHTGIVGMIDAQVQLLRQQPGFNEALARQFGVLPTPSPSTPDPSTLDPQASAQFTGGAVVITFRAPRGLRGVEVAEIRCDRNDGTGVHLVGTTTRARFVDHPDILEGRATFTYYVCYLDEAGVFVGQQSVADVTVQGRVN